MGFHGPSPRQPSGRLLVQDPKAFFTFFPNHVHLQSGDVTGAASPEAFSLVGRFGAARKCLANRLISANRGA